MAYVSPETKARIAPLLKAVCSKYKVKATIAVRNHMALELNVKSAPIDFIGNYNKVITERPCGIANGILAKGYVHPNPYWYEDSFSGVAKEFLKEAFAAMDVGNHNNDDIQSDYFDRGWYVDINIGRWNKPYLLTE